MLDKQSRIILRKIFKDHQVNDTFASYDFNFILMASSAHFIKHSPQQKRLAGYFSKWLTRVRSYHERRGAGD